MDLNKFYINLEKIILDYKSYNDGGAYSFPFHQKSYRIEYLNKHRKQANKNYETISLLVKNEEEIISAWVNEQKFKEQWNSFSSQDQDNLLSFSPDTHYTLRSKLGLEDIKLNLHDTFNNIVASSQEAPYLEYIEKQLNISITKPQNEAQTIALKKTVEQAVKSDFPLYQFKTSLGLDWYIDALYLIILKKFELKERNAQLLVLDSQTPVSLKAVLNFITYARASNQHFLIGQPKWRVSFHERFEIEKGMDLDIKKEKEMLDTNLPINLVNNLAKNIKV